MGLHQIVRALIMLIRTLYLNEKKLDRDSENEIEHSVGAYSQERGTGEARYGSRLHQIIERKLNIQLIWINVQPSDIWHSVEQAHIFC